MTQFINLMTQFINFNETVYRFLSIKCHNFDDKMTQFYKINNTIHKYQ